MPNKTSRNQSQSRSQGRAGSTQDMRTSSSISEPLPNTLEGERAVLGAAILNSESLMVAMQILDRSDFFFEAHQEVFSTLMEMAAEDKPIELASVVVTVGLVNAVPKTT